MTLNERIGFEMRNQRYLKRLTLEEVAKRMGFASKNTISRMELGETMITVDNLVKYCDAVGCSWMDILKKADHASL